VPPVLRIGELLVQARATDPAAVHAALQNQVIFGGRLGTNLLEIGGVKEDVLAAALGQKHRIPSLAGHLELDPRTLALLRPEIADRHDVIPYVLADRRLAVLAADPNDLAMLDEVAFATGKQVHPIVVPEARLWLLLKRAYGVERQLRGIDVDFGAMQTTVPAAPAGEVSPIAAASQDLIDEREFQKIYGETSSFAAGAKPAPAPPLAERSPPPDAPVAPPCDEDEIVELTDLLEPEPEPAAVAEVLAALSHTPGHAPPARFVASAPPEEPEPAPLRFDEALRSLDGVTQRDAIARVILRHARSRFRRAVLLTVNRGVAQGWAGLGEKLTADAVRRIRIPLGAPGIVDTVARTQAHFLGPIPKTEANVRLLKQLGGGVPANALLVPILALGRVANVLYADAGRGALVDATGVGELLILATRIAKSYDALVAKVR
jgi:hypothetical protein